MKRFYSIVVALLTVCLPVWNVQAAVLDLAPVWMEAQPQSETPASPGLGNLSSIQLTPANPAQASAGIMGLVYPAPSSGAVERSLESLSNLELETSLQDELIGTATNSSFWKSKEFLGVLILAFGIGTIFAFLFGSSGSAGAGKTGGGGGGGPSNSSGNDSLPGDDDFSPNGDEDFFPGGDETCLVDCTTTGGDVDDQGDDQGSQDDSGIPDGIPSNPEPSTFLMLGLGLLLPFLRRKV